MTFEAGSALLRNDGVPAFSPTGCVRKLVLAARGEGPGRNYLIEHSAAAKDEQHLVVITSAG